jgi:arabinan endo-1,5-alpha-L-arabinosidase
MEKDDATRMIASEMPVGERLRTGWCRWGAGWLLALALLFGSLSPARALQGDWGAHDPSTIIKRNGVYHVWTTGNQIYHITSTDLVTWTVAPTVFAAGTFPGWISTYVPGFQGNFWAPECVFMNGRYYMYYSCSLGQRPCAIGVATSTDLVNWTDQGMVVYSDNSSPYGCIDPAVFADASGNYWMTFGSHLTGIWTVQIDPATGKRTTNSVLKNVAGSSPYCENEASYVMQHGGYYYLFYNKGICCAGISSTYYVQMGRSLNPDGPFLDQNGVDLLAGGGTNFLVGRDNYLGPGQVGLFTENNINYLSYHYYDGSKTGGPPTLGLGKLTWTAAGWPAVTQDWVAAGTYTIANQGSGKMWAAASCTATAGQALVQSLPTGAACQQWTFLPLGSGVYRITNGNGLSADVAGCAETAGTLLELYPASPLNCQRFRVERAADGTMVLAALYGNRVVEVPNAATTAGTQLGLWNYNGNAAQHWILAAVGTTTATRSGLDAQVQLYPNPAPGGNFSVQLPVGITATVTVLDMNGRTIYRREVGSSGLSDIQARLTAGTYVVRIATAGDVVTRKLLTL